MLKRKIALTLIVLTILPLLPVLTSVHAITYETFNVGVAGSGKVYWSSSYDQAYDTGWVNNCASIATPKGRDGNLHCNTYERKPLQRMEGKLS
ncbi:MAG: hypothetical protein ABSF09_13300 [Candidatus Bathyarchaeia archaeon]|jgi:hypothetical protein